MKINQDAINPLYTFNVKARRYAYKDTGKFLSKEAALSITRKYIESEKSKLIGLADRLESGEIDLFQFQLRATEHLKHIHVSQGILGSDGAEHLTSNDFLWIGRNLKKQYYSGIGEDGRRYGIKWLANDIKEGKVTPAMLKHRLSLYADSGQAVYWQMRRERATDTPYEVRVLDPGAQHCDNCLEYAARGPQPIGELPLPSVACSCRVNCRCSLIQISFTEAIERGLKV